MSRFCQCSFIIGWYCLLTCGLMADTVPTFTATSVSANSGIGSNTNFAAAGDDFTLSGVDLNVGGPFDTGGVPPVSASFFGFTAISSSNVLQAFGHVIVAGTTYPVEYDGFAQVNAPPITVSPFPLGAGIAATSFTLSSGDITAPGIISPSSPSITILLPATVQGSFSACVVPADAVYCSSPPTLADVSINLPGELMFTVNVNYEGGTFPSTSTFSESFTSTPEPASMLLIALGFGILTAFIFRRRLRPNKAVSD